MSNWRADRTIFILVFASVGCFLLSFLAMGLAPWTSLKHVNQASKGGGNPYVDETGEDTAIGRGRKVYIREACWHCHSQFVRPVAGEPFRYGPPSESWETMYDIPQTFGTRRVGPDLSREAGRRSDEWHLAHLYNPRFTTPLSVMPGYPWFFHTDASGKITARTEALDLVSYLQHLGKAHKQKIQEIVHPSVFKVTGAPMADEVSRARGQMLYRENCVGCHGLEAKGDGPAMQFMHPVPANLVDRYIAPSEAYAVLTRGVLGSAMPSFREMPERDLWALALVVSELGAATKEKLTGEAHRPTPEKIAAGKALFQACSVCHGVEGGGDGVAAAGLNPRPKDFTRRVFGRDYFMSIVQDGVPGSAMVGFRLQLKPEEIDALHAYVTSLYRQEL